MQIILALSSYQCIFLLLYPGHAQVLQTFSIKLQVNLGDLTGPISDH